MLNKTSRGGEKEKEKEKLRGGGRRRKDNIGRKKLGNSRISLTLVYLGR